MSILWYRWNEYKIRYVHSFHSFLVVLGDLVLLVDPKWETKHSYYMIQQRRYENIQCYLKMSSQAMKFFCKDLKWKEIYENISIIQKVKRHIIHKSWHKDKAATDILKTKMFWVVYINVCILLNQSQTTSKFQKIINLPSPQSFLFDLVLLGHHVVPRKVNVNKIRKYSWQDHDNQRLIKQKFMFSKSHLIG